MAKFYGPVGYVETVETAPGVWKEQVTEHNHSGDVLKYTRRVQSADKMTDDVVVNIQISMVADPYATDHFQHIRYVKFKGVKWEVATIDFPYPRIILTLGGVYNGQQS